MTTRERLTREWLAEAVRAAAHAAVAPAPAFLVSVRPTGSGRRVQSRDTSASRRGRGPQGIPAMTSTTDTFNITLVDDHAFGDTA